MTCDVCIHACHVLDCFDHASIHEYADYYVNDSLSNESVIQKEMGQAHVQKERDFSLACSSCLDFVRHDFYIHRLIAHCAVSDSLSSSNEDVIQKEMG